MTKIVIGSDEVGWGAVAGPLYVVGVAAQAGWQFSGLKDSKKLSRQARLDLFDDLVEALRGRWALAIVPPAQLDQQGPQPCLVAAHTKVLRELLDKIPKADVDRIIVDGNLRLPELREAVALPKADANFPAVSAASVLAKVLRDDAMAALTRTYPHYGFEEHVGYGTAAHLRAIKKHGLCPAHRRSYLKDRITGGTQEP